MKSLLSFLFLISSVALSESYVDKAFVDISKEQGVSLDLLKSICYVESHHIPHAYRYGDGALNDHAFGICQILYSTGKQFGVNDPKCKRDFRDFTPSERNHSACALFGPRTNIRVAAKLLRYHLQRTNGNEYEAVLSYNAGKYYACQDGYLKINQVQNDGAIAKVPFKRCLKGGPVNLHYVADVADYMDSLWQRSK